MSELLHLAKKAKTHDEDSIGEVIQFFEPKIKQSSRFTPKKEREDLEQELKLQIVKALNRFEEDKTPDFWEFIHHNSK